jgi:hypothetical protein
VENEGKDNIQFIPELRPANPDSVKMYITTQQNRSVAYKELVECLLPAEKDLYRHIDINDPKNLDILALGLQRKQNLEAIINKTKVSENLTEIFNQLPPDALSQPKSDELIVFLSPLEQKVLSDVSGRKPADLDNLLMKKSLIAIAYNRSKQNEHTITKDDIPHEHYPELKPPNPEAVKKHILSQPETSVAYNELIRFLLPEENRLYHQADINDANNLDLLALALQRKQNLEAILNKKNISDNLTVIFNKMPAEILSQSNNEKLMTFLSPFEQKVLTSASENKSENVDNFLIKQSLLAIAYNRSNKY